MQSPEKSKPSRLRRAVEVVGISSGLTCLSVLSALAVREYIDQSKEAHVITLETCAREYTADNQSVMTMCQAYLETTDLDGTIEGAIAKGDAAIAAPGNDTKAVTQYLRSAAQRIDHQRQTTISAGELALVVGIVAGGAGLVGGLMRDGWRYHDAPDNAAIEMPRPA